MVDKQKVVIALLIVAILFSVFATMVSFSILDFKPTAKQPKIVYTSESPEGNLNGGVSINVIPQAGSP